jgi:hypothetical protein
LCLSLPRDFRYSSTVFLQSVNQAQERIDFKNNITNESDPYKSVIRRLDYLIPDHGGNPFQDARFWFYITAYLFLLTALILFVLRKPKSYLILNAASTKYKELSERRRRALESGVVATIILGVISELIGARLSEWINRML